MNKGKGNDCTKIILRDSSFAITKLLGIKTTIFHHRVILRMLHTYTHTFCAITLLFEHSCGNRPDHSQSNEEPSVTWITMITRINVQRVTSRS